MASPASAVAPDASRQPAGFLWVPAGSIGTHASIRPYIHAVFHRSAPTLNLTAENVERVAQRPGRVGVRVLEPGHVPLPAATGPAVRVVRHQVLRDRLRLLPALHDRPPATP